MHQGMFDVHCIIQSSQQPSEVNVILIASVQVRKRDIARSGVLPKVIELVEELGCEPRLFCLEAVLLIVVLTAKLP